MPSATSIDLHLERCPQAHHPTGSLLPHGNEAHRRCDDRGIKQLLAAPSTVLLVMRSLADIR